MATYRIDLYAAAGHLTDVRLLNLPGGGLAIINAHRLIADTGAEHADVWQSDGTGDAYYYATVHNEVIDYGDGDRIYADDLNRMLLAARHRANQPAKPDDPEVLRALVEKFLTQAEAAR